MRLRSLPSNSPRAPTCAPRGSSICAYIATGARRIIWAAVPFTRSTTAACPAIMPPPGTTTTLVTPSLRVGAHSTDSELSPSHERNDAATPAVATRVRVARRRLAADLDEAQVGRRVDEAGCDDLPAGVDAYVHPTARRRRRRLRRSFRRASAQCRSESAGPLTGYTVPPMIATVCAGECDCGNCRADRADA